MAKQTKKAPKKATKAAAPATAKKTAKKAAPAKKAATKKAAPKAAAPAPAQARPTTINTYLTFNGNCEEAFKFYKKVFGGEFVYFGRFRDVPSGADNKPLPAAEGKKIMHVSLPISKETILMGSDTSESMGPRVTQGNNFSISISAGSKAEADRLHKALSAKGNVVMPMNNTFWGAYFGMLVDKFGINWMVSFDQQPQGM